MNCEHSRLCRSADKTALSSALWRCSPELLVGMALVICMVGQAWPQVILLTAHNVGTNGLAIGPVNLTEPARLCGKLPWFPGTLIGIETDTERRIPIEFVPDVDFNPSNHLAGTIVARMPASGEVELRLDEIQQSRRDHPGSIETWRGRVVGPGYTAEHDPKQQGGLPFRISFGGGRVLDSFRWNNRLHHRTNGSFCMSDDVEASVERVASGTVCTVIRAKSRFVQGGRQPSSQPTAVYDLYYFSNLPLVLIRSKIRQNSTFLWDEVHPLELNYSGHRLPQWAGGEPPAEGRFEATRKSFPQSAWGLVHDGTVGIGMFQGGQVLLHDGGNGTYIQAHGDSAWHEWNGLECGFSTWLWLGSGSDPTSEMQHVVRSWELGGGWSVTLDTARAFIDAARNQLRTNSVAGGRRAGWRVQGAKQLEAEGRLQESMQVANGGRPHNWSVLQSGDLGLILERADDGIRVLSLFDSANERALLTAKPLPLFHMTLQETAKNEQVKLAADHGWQNVLVEEEGDFRAGSIDKGLRVEWRKPADQRLGDLRVVARVTAAPKSSLLRWTFSVRHLPEPWSVWRVVFPQVAVADLGRSGAVFFPKAAGQVERDPWRRSVRFSGTYPGGWTSMQFMAAYDEAGSTGLYLATHDPWGSTKDLRVESRPSEHCVVLSFDHPVPDMGKAGNTFELSGVAVWQLLHGDWFDAAVAYRDWVRKEARWFPRLTREGRADTPAWMRQLSVWALSGGPASNCVPEVQAFTDFLGQPAAVHWYNWHEIPFDNDYPHYFPAKPGFAEGVRHLQGKGTFVMPYINGRLWDRRDQGTNDFEFTKRALPAASKDSKGAPFLESYGSKETDGTPVQLGVMCPTTELWQKQVRSMVLRLMTECGVKAVYIDQIAAAAPTLCADATHGHPLGGGHWWTEGYWKMLDSIRRAMPRDCVLTTECNGEPFIRFFDGYLTWHWQYDGQVPAFPAVYGGALQMFGRSYGGGTTRDLALRMRVGQQFVFGEQLGWISPGVVKEKENAAFLRQAVALRRELAQYFYSGEMARPPWLRGTIPTVRADWQWQGVAWVTTDAVLSGSWHLPSARRLVLLFANVSPEPVTAEVDFDATAYGYSRSPVRLRILTSSGMGDVMNVSPRVRRLSTFEPQSLSAWEITAR